MLVKSANGSFECIDFRETAPAAAYEDMFIGANETDSFQVALQGTDVTMI
jgi:gamma-glutamyltranspeptidase/glutathione hydrolase